MEGAFRVFVRVRPPAGREVGKMGKRVLRVQGDRITVTDYRREAAFSFEGVFPESIPTSSVYQSCLSSLVSSSCDGFNATCFAYGMTGAGKTHTMFGDMYLETAHQPGLVSLSLADLLQRTDSRTQLKLSYLEIYNERVIDLLSEELTRNLRVVDDPGKGIQVQGLREIRVRNLREVTEMVLLGNRHRAKAATGANQFSTRSHALLTISIERRTDEGPTESILTSKLSLIDLAGSERACVSDNRGARMVEGANINRSLLALGTCINILSDPCQQGRYIPYRDSKLTRLLRDSLGGNTKTVMIACVSPCLMAVEETVHTLNYADRARRIEKKVERNLVEVERHVSEYKEIISGLQREIETLKAQVQSQDSLRSSIDPAQDVRALAGSEEVSKELLENFEEHWELKQNIQDIDSLNTQNKARIKQLLGELETAKSDNDGGKATTIKTEIVSTHQSIRENEESRNELLKGLYVRDRSVEYEGEVEAAEELE